MNPFDRWNARFWAILCRPVCLYLLVALALFALLVKAQVTPPPPIAPVITATSSAFPASLSIFADKGDLTYCTFSALTSYAPRLSGTCRRAGATIYTASVLTAPAVVSAGDVTISFAAGQQSNQVRFIASVNVRTPNTVTVAIARPVVPFLLGEPVNETSPNPAVNGTVAQYTTQDATNTTNGVQQQYANQSLTLTMGTGPLTLGATLIGQTSGAVAQVLNQYPAMTTVEKAEGLITWPVPPPAPAP